MEPTKKEILRELRGLEDMMRNSYKEIDGKVRDKEALHTIACLKAAIKIVKKGKP